MLRYGISNNQQVFNIATQHAGRHCVTMVIFIKHIYAPSTLITVQMFVISFKNVFKFTIL